MYRAAGDEVLYQEMSVGSLEGYGSVGYENTLFGITTPLAPPPEVCSILSNL